MGHFINTPLCVCWWDFGYPPTLQTLLAWRVNEKDGERQRTGVKQTGIALGNTIRYCSGVVDAQDLVHYQDLYTPQIWRPCVYDGGGSRDLLVYYRLALGHQASFVNPTNDHGRIAAAGGHIGTKDWESAPSISARVGLGLIAVTLDDLNPLFSLAGCVPFLSVVS